MTKIGLLSDTHGYLNPKCYEFFRDCDEIWHAGDIGNIQVADALSEFKTLKAVFGNIDGQDIRAVFKEYLVFRVGQVKVLMMHIGGYPGHYSKAARELITRERPDLFVTGHSHILRVMYDQKLDCLHMNPGAAGKSGIHRSVTMIRFVIDQDQIKDLEVLDLRRNEQ
jgi:putative phosphoesterase